MAQRQRLARSLHLAIVTLAVAAITAGCGAGKPVGAGRPAMADSARLYLAGDGELWIVDVVAERSRHLALRRLGPGDPPYRVIRRGRRLVLSGAAMTYVADAGFQGPLRTLARHSWFFMPSAHPGRVWIAYLDPRSPATVRALRAVREMTAGGRVTVPDVRPPSGRWPQVALASGLLFYTREGAFALWDPVARTIVRRLPARRLGELGPAHGDVLASCPDRCRALRLTDVRTGARRDIPAPDGLRFDVHPAAFSPDGRTLAAPLHAGDNMPRQLALIDVAHATARLVPGTDVPSGYTFVAWSASGREVFITGGQRFAERTIAAYRLGAARARVLDVTVGDFYGMAAR